MSALGILQSLFGGSSQKSESGNKAYGAISSAYSPAMGYTGEAGGAVSKFLGGDASGFDAYKDATGFDWGAEQGSRGITGNAAARGLLNSGSTQKALVRYGNDYSQQFAKDYISQYLGLGQLGLGAGGLVANAGQYSQGSGSSSSGGLGKAIGTALSLFSDRRLKRDIVKLGEEADGLGRYRYRYLWEHAPREGVMASEVAALRPWALGPEIGGYMTVRYDLLEAA